MATPCIRTPCPGVMKVSFVRPFIANHNYSLSDLCLGVNKIFKEIMYFHYMTYMAKLVLQEPLPRGSSNL